MIIGIEPELEIPVSESEPPAHPELEVVESETRYAKFVVEPLKRGFGATLGNALRRVLLGSLPGAAITAVQIQGIQHEYSTIPDVREDVSEILMNLKRVRLKPLGDQEGLLRLEVQGPGQVTAGDLQPSADFEVANPELYLASLDSAKVRLSMELRVEIGTGYVVATSTEDMPIGFIPLDATFTPIVKVNYAVGKTRVGQVTDYERLTLEVWTDGAKGPQEAVREAANILMDSFSLFGNVGLETADDGEGRSLPDVPLETFNMPIEKLELSARTLNCLKRSKINKVGEILEKSQDELLKIKNFGDKSLVELNERLEAMGIVSKEAVASLEEADEPEPADATVEADAEGLVEAEAETPAVEASAAVEPETEAASAQKKEPKSGAKSTLKDLGALREVFGGGDEQGGEEEAAGEQSDSTEAVPARD